MKRIGNLYEQIISLYNLRLADEKARRGKPRSYGVQVHDQHRESNILKLHELLKSKRFKTSPYETFTIYEPKERLIFRLPYYPDRIVHHAIMNILEILKQIVRRKIKCKDTLDLLDQIIDSADGVPIGNYLSQYFANLYLTYFDHWIKEVVGVKYYFRYADDMVFLHRDKAFLHGLLVQINDYLSCQLNLALKGNYQVFPVEARGIDYVGFVFRHSHTLLRKSIKKNFCRAAAKLNKRGNISEKEYLIGLCSWLGWVKHSNSKHLLKSITKEKYYGNLRRKTLGIRGK